MHRFKQIGRRSFVATLLAQRAAVGALSRNRLSFIADEVGPLEEAIAFARKYGLRFIELRGLDGEPESQAREIRRKLDDAGLTCSFLNSATFKFTLSGTSPVRVDESYEGFYRKRGWTPESLYRRRLHDFEEHLGVRRVRSFSFFRIGDPSGLAMRLADEFGPILEIARKHSVQVLLENEASTNIATSAESAAILAKVPGLLLNWDPQNSAEVEDGVFPSGYKLLPARRIANVQIKAEGLLGRGKFIDWAAVLPAMDRNGYHGKFGLETHLGKTQFERRDLSHTCMQALVRMVS